MVVVGVWLFYALLNAIWEAYRHKDPAPDYAIEGPVQAAKLGAFVIGLVLALSILLGRSPLYLFTGLGALSAVLMLIFKEPITGFTAGIQLSTNRMVAPGDWIEMPRYDANGDVLEVGLTNVGVFRAYAERYLRSHPMIHQDMTLLVRQLQPTEHGLPIELYAFCKDTDWGRYESVALRRFDPARIDLHREPPL